MSSLYPSERTKFTKIQFRHIFPESHPYNFQRSLSPSRLPTSPSPNSVAFSPFSLSLSSLMHLILVHTLSILKFSFSFLPMILQWVLFPLPVPPLLLLWHDSSSPLRMRVSQGLLLIYFSIPKFPWNSHLLLLLHLLYCCLSPDISLKL